MPIGVTNKRYYQDIAYAIREKNGTQDTYTPSEMAQAILDIEGGGEVTPINPVQYRAENRDKGWPYIPLPSEMKNSSSPYYESGDCIYMLYDARNEMANPAFRLQYTNASCIAYKYRAGGTYFTIGIQQISANHITHFMIDGVMHAFLPKFTHPIGSLARIVDGYISIYENNVMIEKVPVFPKTWPTQQELVDDLRGTTWKLADSPVLPAYASATDSEDYFVNFSSNNETFDLLQLFNNKIKYVNTSTLAEITVYSNSTWNTSYQYISFSTTNNPLKNGLLMSFCNQGTISYLPSLQFRPDFEEQQPTLISQETITLKPSGTGIEAINYLTFYYGDVDWNNYDYLLLVIKGNISEYNIAYLEFFNNIGYNSSATSEILEVSGKCLNCSIGIVGQSSNKFHRQMEYFSFDHINNTSLVSCFFGCVSLKAIVELNVETITNMQTAFNSCYALQAIPNFDTSNVTKFNSTFQNCYSIRAIPNLNTSSTTDMSYMFGSCYVLQAIPMFDTSSVTLMDNTFNNCFALKEIPLLDTSNVTSMKSIFQGCRQLATIPLLDTSNVKNMSYMFGSCYALKFVPKLNTSEVTDMSYMFHYCYALKEIPLLDTSNVKNMSYMFNQCESMLKVPEIDTSSVTNMSYMFYGCYSLNSIPELDTSSVTNITYMFAACHNIRTIPKLDMSHATTVTNCFSCILLTHGYIYGAKKAFSLSQSTLLSESELVNILQNLGVVTTSTTLTLGTTNLNKLTAAEKAIATKKGWTLA